MDNTLAAWFDQDDGARQASLNRARRMAALTDPSVLPPSGHTQQGKMPDVFQSDGAMGTNHLVGLMLMSLFPPTQLWFQLQLPADVYHDPRLPAEMKTRADEWMMLVELQAQAVLESAAGMAKSGRLQRASGFRSAMRRGLDQLVVTGDVLQRMLDDFRIVTFGREGYVTKRDGAGDVLYHIVKEQIDPLSLRGDQLSKAELIEAELKDMRPGDRMQDIYTLVQWNPQKKVWTISQQVNGKDLPLNEGSGDTESEETISPFFSTPFKLPPGYDYGIGFPESMASGCLRSLNELELRRLEMLGLASKKLMALDHSSPTRESDLRKGTGNIIRAKVRGGVVDDVGPVEFVGLQEFQMLTEGINDKSTKLGKAMLMESAAGRDAERVTKFERQRLAGEIDLATGGLYTPTADNIQLPCIQRTLYQLRVKNELPSFVGGGAIPDEYVEINTLTGLSALAREAEAGKLLEIAQVVQMLPEKAQARIDHGMLLEAIVRARNVYVPGMVRTEEEAMQIRQAEMDQEVAAEAATQASGAVADVAKQQASAQ